MLVNGLGATATAVTVVVVLVAKFTEGAWITVVLIPVMILTMRGIKAHYDRVQRETWLETPVNTKNIRAPLVVIPLERWDTVAERALRFAWNLSRDVRILHVECGEETEHLRQCFAELIETPAIEAGLPAPELVLLNSPYRFIVRPIVDYSLNLERDNPDREVAVLIPELVEIRWYYFWLHNNRAAVLKALLLFSGNQRITVVNIPWYMKA